MSEESTCVVLTGSASGDLTKRKLIPALYNLAKENLLSREFALIGLARPEMTTQQFATGQVDPSHAREKRACRCQAETAVALRGEVSCVFSRAECALPTAALH